MGGGGEKQKAPGKTEGGARWDASGFAEDFGGGDHVAEGGEDFGPVARLEAAVGVHPEAVRRDVFGGAAQEGDHFLGGWDARAVDRWAML